MKRFDKIKTVQMMFVAALTVIALVIVFRDKELFQMIAQNVHIKALAVLLWAALGSSFLFMFLDIRTFTNLRKENNELDFAVYTDPLTGVANRNSCDAYIENYEGVEIPEGIGAATIIMAGMKELNEKFGHEKGDSDIREFAEILQAAAPDDCFIGRNGGIKFLLIFPQWTPKDWRAFETALAGRVRERNEASPEGDTLACVIGVAYQGEEEANSFSELVAMSDRRAAAKLSGPSPKSAGPGDTEK